MFIHPICLAHFAVLWYTGLKENKAVTAICAKIKTIPVRYFGSANAKNAPCSSRWMSWRRREAGMKFNSFVTSLREFL